MVKPYLTAALLLIAFTLGWSANGYIKNGAMANLKASYIQAQLQSNKEYAAKLEHLREQRNNAELAAVTLHEQLQTLEQTQYKQNLLINKEINHAIEQDKTAECQPGLGANALRLYRTALGYAD